MTSATLSRFATHENSAYPQLWRGCVGAWCPSLGPSGARLHDYSRRQNWGTLTNMDPATDWVVSGGQYALDFDGSNDYVSLANETPLYNFERSSVAVWVYQTASSGEPFVYSENRAIDNSVVYLLRTSNGPAQFGRFSALSGSWSFSTDSVNLPQNSWQHLCGTFEAGVGTKLYRNGVQVASAATGGFATQAISARDIARYASPASYWPGQIDDLMFFNRVLSPAEVRLLARRRGIAFTPRTRARATPEQAAGGATPWLYARRRSQIIGSGGVH